MDNAAPERILRPGGSPWLPHDGALWQADEPALELAATIMAHIRTHGLGKNAGPLVTRLESLLARFGMTPSDRSRVHVAKPAGPNEFDFLDRSGRPRRGR